MTEDTKNSFNAEPLSSHETKWRAHREASILQKTQDLTPEKWERFYDEVSGVWDEITGCSGLAGDEIAGFICQKGIISPGSSVLDIGCGPGALSLSLAQKGCHVTALDNSAGMIRTLKKKVAEKNVSHFTPICADWRTFVPGKPFDLVICCFFPDALSPEGLQRMESFSSGGLALVLGDGRETFPIRREIWKDVMDTPLKKGTFHMDCTEKYLSAANRHPQTANLCVPARLHMDEGQLAAYFKAYFAIFDKKGERVDTAIKNTLASYRQGTDIRLEGTSHFSLLWWERKENSPCLTGDVAQ